MSNETTTPNAIQAKLELSWRAKPKATRGARDFEPGPAKGLLSDALRAIVAAHEANLATPAKPAKAAKKSPAKPARKADPVKQAVDAAATLVASSQEGGFTLRKKLSERTRLLSVGDRKAILAECKRIHAELA